MAPVSNIRTPIANGIVQNFEDMEKVWRHTFEQLHMNPEEDPAKLKGIMLTEAPL